MKKLATLFTVLGLLSISSSAFAACGTNAGRNSPTRAPSAPTTTTPSTGGADVAIPAGTPR